MRRLLLSTLMLLSCCRRWLFRRRRRRTNCRCGSISRHGACRRRCIWRRTRAGSRKPSSTSISRTAAAPATPSNSSMPGRPMSARCRSAWSARRAPRARPSVRSPRSSARPICASWSTRTRRWRRSPICAARPWSYSRQARGRRSSTTYLKSGGLTRNDLKVDVVDPAALWGTYIAKRADGLMSTVGSALPIAEEPRPSKCLLASDANITFPSYGLVARDETIASKGPALKRLIQVEQRAWQHLRANPEDGVKAMIAERPDARLNPAILLGQIKLTLDYFDTPASQRQADRLAGQGRLGSRAQVDGSRRRRQCRLECRRLLHQRACRVT